MKSSFFYLIVALFIIAVGCKKSEEKIDSEASEMETTIDAEKTSKQNDGMILFTGDFLFYDGAAVLNTGKTVYGVIVNDKMYQLDSLVEPYKKEPTDMIHVGIRGSLIPKAENEEGWDYSIEIKEIVDVYPELKPVNHS